MVKIKPSRNGDRAFNAFLTVIMTLVVIVMLYPFWYVLVSSLSTLFHVQNTTFILLPDGLHFEAYEQVLRNELVPNAYLNTITITIGGTLISMALTILGSFVLSRRDLPGRNIMMLFVVITMLFNGGLVPLYLLVNNLSMLNTLWSLILPTCINTYNMVILRNFFQATPTALFEAATLDGANVRTYLVRVLLPLSGSALATITLFYAVGYWNAYYYSLIFITKRDLWPMQAVLRQVLMSNDFQSMMYDDGVQNLPSEMLKDAMIVVTALPIICVYPFIQRYFVKGVMVGSLKG